MVSVVQYSPIERLREVDTNLRVLRRTANGDVRIRSCFQGPKAVTNDENSRTETAERSIEDAWPCCQLSVLAG
jgi:hypothetical protein